MVKSGLEVYARIKPPHGQKTLQYGIDKARNKLELQISRSKVMSFYKDSFEFNFSKVFDKATSQEDIFNDVALPAVKNCLDGYNGTVFAYGQTGSGKTFTMSGGESWKQRGIMPRVLSSLFAQMQARQTTWDHRIAISFMQIYNQNAYDLFEKRHLESSFEKWTKITFHQDDEGITQMKNLSVHEIKEQQQGIDLLMMGNYIKKVSATSLNQSSSRSHCVFTITIFGKNNLDETEFVSKLHLVDLAGSERLSKSQVQGNLLSEAKSINLSLSYLEQVIVALNDRQKGSRTHIPYRNSLMTTILKDSLGGNCRTVMIATISVDQDNTEETISTLRFSQRVGQLENQVVKNSKENSDVKLKTLQKQNEQLKRTVEQQNTLIRELREQRTMRDISLIHSNQEENQSRLPELHNRVEGFFNDKSKILEVKSVKEATVCFQAMKQLYHYRMKEYITELTFISEKLHKYDQLLSKKKTMSLRQFSDC